jgi:hypothetical protein
LSLVTFQMYLYVIILEYVFSSACTSFLYLIFNNLGNELFQHDIKTKLFL